MAIELSRYFSLKQSGGLTNAAIHRAAMDASLQLLLRSSTFSFYWDHRHILPDANINKLKVKQKHLLMLSTSHCLAIVEGV